MIAENRCGGCTIADERYCDVGEGPSGSRHCLLLERRCGDCTFYDTSQSHPGWPWGTPGFPMPKDPPVRHRCWVFGEDQWTFEDVDGCDKFSPRFRVRLRRSLVRLSHDCQRVLRWFVGTNRKGKANV